MKRFFSFFLRDRSGAAAAEMALMLPLLVAILFAGVEGGYFLWNEHRVIKSVRDGARYAGRQFFSTVDCDGSIGNDAAIRNLVRTGTLDGSGDPLVRGWTGNDTITISVECDDNTKTGIYAYQPNGASKVTVSARVPYLPLFDTLGFIPSGLHLNAAAQAPVVGL